MTSPTLVWFRQDLRLADNPALQAVAQTGAPVLALYVLDETTDWALGAASRWWLHHSLQHLQQALQQQQVQLVLRRGKPQQIVPALVKECGIGQVFWNRRYARHQIEADKNLKADLQAQGVKVTSANSHLLHEPWQIKNKTGACFRVFTPFWKHIRELPVPQRMPAPKLTPFKKIASDSLADWQLLPTQPNWAKGFEAAWQPGEAGAKQQLDEFLEQGLRGYAEKRDRPDLAHVSRLSPYLAFGEISPRQIWWATKGWQHATGHEKDAEKFLSELAWREFSYHLLYHFPDFPTANYRPEFDDFPWQNDAEGLRRWQQGQTGYPIVDAGMRQLWHTGWMHNRVRMIVASFLIKDLLIDWREGERWFWDTLVDADLANNAASWQWVAGSGADASPYFRIFNPMTQGERFDPEGHYVRQWVPELKDLPKEVIHQPWTADSATLAKAGVTLGETYPKPMVNHAQARDRALAAFKQIKK